MESKIRQHIIDLDITKAIVSIESDNKSFIIAHGQIDTNTQFKIGSITKTFIGFIILQLVQEGKIDMDDLISKHLNDVPDISIRHVAHMRSGLYDYTKDEHFEALYDVNPNHEYQPIELLQYSLSHKLNFEPNTDFEYSNTNSIVLGLIIEKVTCNSLKQEVHNRIINPLNLVNTTFDTNPIFDDLATHWGWAAGSIVSTVSDLLIYCDFIKDNFLNSWPSYKQLTNLDIYYGFHLAKIKSYHGHNGSLPGTSCYLLCNHNTKIIIVANAQINKNGINPANSLMELIVNELAEIGSS